MKIDLLRWKDKSHIKRERNNGKSELSLFFYP